MIGEANESMRKMFLFMTASVGGYFEGPNHELDWHDVDNEFIDFAVKQLDEVDTLIFGRKTYEMTADFWSSDQAIAADPETAKKMNALPKIVFSHSPRKANWQNTKTYNEDIVPVVKDLKQHSGKAIAVFGSSNLCLTLLKHRLLGELRIMVNRWLKK